jgi:HSP20 family molecular chaperone IbpA
MRIVYQGINNLIKTNKQMITNKYYNLDNIFTTQPTNTVGNLEKIVDNIMGNITKKGLDTKEDTPSSQAPLTHKVFVLKSSTRYCVYRTEQENGVDHEFLFEAPGFEKDKIEVNVEYGNLLRIKGVEGGLLGNEQLSAAITSGMTLEGADINVTLDKGLLKVIIKLINKPTKIKVL